MKFSDSSRHQFNPTRDHVSASLDTLEQVKERVNFRSVRPLTPNHARQSVIAVQEDAGVLVEQIWNASTKSYIPALETTPSAKRVLTPEEMKEGYRTTHFYSFDQFHILFPLLPRDTVIMTDNAISLAAYLYRIFHNGFIMNTLAEMHGDFNITLNEREKDIAFRADAPRITHRINQVSSVGFAALIDKKANHYYIMVNAPTFFSNSGLRSHKWNLMDLLQAGQTLADECSDIGVKFKCSPGAIAAQMLRHPTHYAFPRRRVPKSTNERAREAALGHAYELKVPTNQMVKTTVQFDQARSHTVVASEIPLPHSDGLYSHGEFDTESIGCTYRHGSKLYDKYIAQFGLFDAILYNRNPKNEWVPRQYREDGPFRQYVTSNELRYLSEQGISVESIIGCWTSPIEDEGIRSYALQGLRRIDNREGIEREVIKTVINSGIGVLGARPRTHTLIRTREIRGGEPDSIHTRNGDLPVFRKRFRGEYQLAVANMVQRVMIERECAIRSYEFAAHLDSIGWEIVNVYADSVFAIQPEQSQLFEPPPHWKIETVHTNLQFKSATVWISDQGERFPGVMKSARSRARGQFTAQAS